MVERNNSEKKQSDSCKKWTHTLRHSATAGMWIFHTDQRPQFRNWMGFYPVGIVCAASLEWGQWSQRQVVPATQLINIMSQLILILLGWWFCLIFGLVSSLYNFIQCNLKCNYYTIVSYFCYTFSYSSLESLSLIFTECPGFVNCKHIPVNCCLVSLLSSLYS